MTPPPVPRAGYRELIAWIFRRRRRHRVAGVSMFPTLSEGATVFVRETSSAPEGSVVVIDHPRRPGLHIVKRLSFVDEAGLFVISDNRDAIDAADSQTFGPVPEAKLIGVVTAQLS